MRKKEHFIGSFSGDSMKEICAKGLLAGRQFLMVRTFSLRLFYRLVFCLPFLLSVNNAMAGEKSVYTDLDLNLCHLVAEAEEGEGEWATFSCKGYQGMVVYVTEADLRFSLGYGPSGREQKSVSQFLGPFNTVGKKLEWRLHGDKVVATILRYYTQTGSAGVKGQILVVSKVSGGEACHAAYVDALANKAANVLAHYAADYIAPDFQCGQDEPVHLGKRGVSPF